MSFEPNRETLKESGKPNKEYVIDVARALQYTRWLLEILGVWPMLKNNPKNWQIYSSKMLMAICSMLMASTMIPGTISVITMRANLIDRLMLFGPVGFCVQNMITYYLIIYRCSMIKRILEHVEIDWMSIETENDREIMTRNVNVGRQLTAICAIFMYTGGLSFHTITPMLRGNGINELNETVRPLVYPGYDLFVDPQKSPNYETIFYTNCITAGVMYSVTTSACSLAAILVAHSCGQIEITMSRLETLFDGIDETSEIVKIRVGFIVKTHVRVLRLTSMIEILLREMCLVIVASTTIVMCLLEYYCLMEWDNSKPITRITNGVLLLSLFFNVFIFCHIGELLKEKSSQIGNAAYMMDWYRLPGKTHLALVMIIAMANSPRRLTAGRMMELSVRSFGTVIKTSVAYLNMLRTVTA